MMKAKFQVTTFMVKGSGEFPIDMLRHDSCCPDTEIDTNQIRRSAEERVVTLRRFYPVGGIAWPTNGRWASFGWPVQGVV